MPTRKFYATLFVEWRYFDEALKIAPKDAVTLNDRGVNSLMAPFTIVLSGSLLPLPLFPSWLHDVLFMQPLAGVLDIPFRIYTGSLTGVGAAAGIGLQVFWTIAFVIGGHVWMDRVMRRLQVQGG